MNRSMKETVVVNLRKNDYDVYIGRGSKWGNPFTHIKDRNTKAEHIVATRTEALNRYREWIKEQPMLLNSLEELRGKRLGCYCKPKTCHGDILVELLTQRQFHTLF